MKIFVALSLVVLLILLIQNKVRPSFLFGGLASIYYIFGILDLKAWMGSFTNDSLLTLLLLLLVSLSIEKTVLIRYCSDLIIQLSYKKSLLRLGIVTSVLSAFINNTAVVASLMFIVKNNNKHLPSKLLIPLSYIAIFGGTMTLVGTSTNLIVNSFVIQSGLPSLKMFDFFAVGFLITVVGIITLYLASSLLPSYKAIDDSIEEHIIEATIFQESVLIGKVVKEHILSKLEYFYLVEIRRGDKIIIPVNDDEILEAKDILVFSGDIKHIEEFKEIAGLSISNGVNINKLDLVDTIVVPQSLLVGQKVKDINFKAKFDAAIISFKRGDRSLSKISGQHIEAGDRLVLAVGKNFQNLDNITENFYTFSNIKQNIKFSRIKSFGIIGIFIAIIALSALGIVSLIKALLVFLIGLLVFKALDFKEIQKRFPYDIFIIVGSSLAISKVISESGLGSDLASLIINSFGQHGVYWSFIGVYIVTLMLTEVITNNAAAALSFPIAYATASGLEVSYLPFVFAVAYGASAGFMIPYGYQTHLMVSSLCNYKIKDFLKIGWIVSLVYSLVVIIFVPFIFPFETYYYHLSK